MFIIWLLVIIYNQSIVIVNKTDYRQFHYLFSVEFGFYVYRYNVLSSDYFFNPNIIKKY